jgi:pilus assembly protein Flp/PilA
MLTKISELGMRLVARLRSEEGQALTEYGLILALIAGVSILALTAVGLAVSDTLACVQEGFT